jgi:signal transduction histidine kinase
MKWYRSLYWRIAVGIVAFLAAMLVVQAMLLVWTVSRSGGALSGQPPARRGQAVAVDLSRLLEREPQADLSAYLKDQYADDDLPFYVVMADGRIITNGTVPISEAMLAATRAWLERAQRSGISEGRFGRGNRGGRSGPPERFDAGFPADGGPRGLRPIPILVNLSVAGAVVVPPQVPFGVLLNRFAPMLAFVAAGVLVLGTVVATLLIFGPARRRLRELESAARSLGAGDLSVRAPDRGGDEIAAVANAFNAMAGDLAARANALAESDRVRRQLLADVSHELTTPVTAMRGYLETLSMPELQLDEATRRRYLSIVGDETARLEHIIGDLLDLARLEGGGGSFTVSDVSVPDLFARVAARHERASEQAGISIETAIEAGADSVVGDRDRLEQALQNLAANAIRYAPAGSTVRLRARPAASDDPAQPEDGVTLSVEDEGPGIGAEHLPHLFDRFYKVDASRPGKAGGSGLGLSIVKAIVERHGGRIAVTSRPGRTVFEIVMPRSG